MDQKIKFPDWKDVGIPSLLVDLLRSSYKGKILDFVVSNKVFKISMKTQYLYTCRTCSYKKKMSRIYEDYSTCEHCGNNLIFCKPLILSGKDKIEPYSQVEDLVNPVIDRMVLLFTNYFKEYPPDEFLTCGWNLNIDKTKKIVDLNKNNNQPASIARNPPVFNAKFACGEEVSDAVVATAVCKAAILCPFIWDSKFDWKQNIPRDKQGPIVPFLYHYLKSLGNRSMKMDLSDKGGLLIKDGMIMPKLAAPFPPPEDQYDEDMQEEEID